MSKGRFKVGAIPTGPVTGLDQLLGTGPGEAPTTEAAVQSHPVDSSLAAYKQRMVAQYRARRSINITAVATPEVKAELATISRMAEDTTGSSQFTESAILRAIAELLVEEGGIDWAGEFSRLRPDEVNQPVQAIKTILSSRMDRGGDS